MSDTIPTISIYSTGVCYVSICTSRSIEDAIAWVNDTHPTGLDHGWSLSKDKTFADGSPMPCRCEHYSHTHRHYLLDC